ncbi:ABC transporter permease [Acidocella sp.]|uniref:ABC transporter permease n=1 Tax=Acidocella sp. TaxID=50710 RepID=UPI002603675E|nr:ABC transporter permease [Acidocella sp.]
MRQGVTSWLGRRPGRHGTLAAGLGLAGLVLFCGFIAPFLYPADPYAIHPAQALRPPSRLFPLGTDELGRDALALLLSGGFSTLAVALPAAALAFLTGAAYGFAAGLGPLWLDKALMRLLDVALALPGLIVLLFFAALVPQTNLNLILLLGLISWPGLARLVRNEARAQRGRDFILAAEQAGASRAYLALVHLSRIVAPVLVVNATFMTGDAILSLSALSFLGLGVQPPQESWGSLLESGLSLAALNPWWLILPPGLLIFAALLAAAMTGQGLLTSWQGDA